MLVGTCEYARSPAELRSDNARASGGLFQRKQSRRMQTSVEPKSSLHVRGHRGLYVLHRVTNSVDAAFGVVSLGLPIPYSANIGTTEVLTLHVRGHRGLYVLHRVTDSVDAAFGVVSLGLPRY